MFEDVLIEQNPQWEDKRFAQGVPRDCFQKLTEYLPLPHVISVTGVRRAGKSTLLKQLIHFLIDNHQINPKNILFLNLEHPYFAQYSNDVKYLEKIFEDYQKITNPKGKIYCFLDEIQFFSGWPIFVKAHYEQKNVKFVITGSNSFLMSHELLTLLSGRTLPVEVYPLSFLELIKDTTKIDPSNAIIVSKHRHRLRAVIDTFLQYGGFPEVALNDDTTSAYDILNAYAKTILLQDVCTRLNIKKPIELERLFYYLTSHIGTLFTYSSLAKIFNLNEKTIKEYIVACSDANLLFELDKFSFSLKQQIRSEKKIYSIDTGMVNSIAFKFSENRGRLFENAVFLELKRRGCELYYYKTQANLEVDFVVKKKDVIQLIQVCADLETEKTRSREIQAIVKAAKELNLTTGTIITADEELELTVDEIHITMTPLYKFVLKTTD